MEVLAGRVVLVPLVVVEPAIPVELWREVDFPNLDIGVEGSHKSLVALPLVGGRCAIERVGGVGLVAVAELSAKGSGVSYLRTTMIEDARGREIAVGRGSVGTGIASRKEMVGRGKCFYQTHISIGIAISARGSMKGGLSPRPDTYSGVIEEPCPPT